MVQFNHDDLNDELSVYAEPSGHFMLTGTEDANGEGWIREATPAEIAAYHEQRIAELQAHAEAHGYPNIQAMLASVRNARIDQR